MQDNLAANTEKTARNDLRNFIGRVLAGDLIDAELPDADFYIDTFADATAAAELRSFANTLSRIREGEGYNADPARRRALDEVISLARATADHVEPNGR